MASRTKQKEEARARRLDEERARTERTRRQRRTRMLGGVVIGAVALVAVAIAIGSGGGTTTKAGSAATAQSPAAACKAAGATATCATVNTLLAGIPQSGMTLGSPTAKVTVTEFGDLECPICKDFALGAQTQLISNDVKSGKVKVVYRSLETATGNGPNASWWVPQQASANAAGAQNVAWNYIELFYHEQGSETSTYVNQAYLAGLAKQVPALNYTTWQAAQQSSTYTTQVATDSQAASAKGFNSTPTIVVQGPKGSAQPIVGNTDYGTLQSAIKSVS
jgi:protein-disulfide isomerase